MGLEYHIKGMGYDIYGNKVWLPVGSVGAKRYIVRGEATFRVRHHSFVMTNCDWALVRMLGL